jgi:3-hydroxybutyryl-CoA dehydrogenase
MNEVHRVAVIGAGIMGHGMAQLFALRGLEVSLVDRSRALLERAQGWIRENLDHMVELGELRVGSVEAALERIHLHTELSAVSGAQFVVEAVNEELDLKRRIFGELGSVTTSDTTLATNTSSFDINELARAAAHPQRVIGTHWFHPSPITPCVEVIPADTTHPDTVRRTVALMERIGKYPTLCKSAPGFVANRIQFAMVAEALAIVEEGLAKPEEVDRIVRSSFGFRLGAYGPFEICDQAGLDTYGAVFRYLHEKLGRPQFNPPPLLDRLASQGRLGLKAKKGFYDYGGDAEQSVKRQRDRRLYARLRLFQGEK